MNNSPACSTYIGGDSKFLGFSGVGWLIEKIDMMLLILRAKSGLQLPAAIIAASSW
jgi:hypothetical protein